MLAIDTIDCISNSHYSIEIKEDIKNGKDHDTFLDFPKNIIFGHVNIKSPGPNFNLMLDLIEKKILIFLK